MPRYLCSSCQEAVEMAGTGRFDWCSSCGAPLTAEDRMPMRLLTRDPSQASGGSIGDADLAAPALATTTNPIATTSAIPRISPSTT
jgi:predicted amidophosphoribosyltransferase